MKEIEAKFFVLNLGTVRERLLRLGGRVISERRLERNWRFDRPDRSLSSADIVLRLRQDARAYLTYKSRAGSIEERQEIELQVESATEGRAFLEGLGFEAVASYEKHREQFSYSNTVVALDELPFGEFVEVEGASLASIEAESVSLGLSWPRRVQRSYLELFDEIRTALALSGQEASFEAFRGLPPIDPARLKLEDATVEFEHGA